MLAACGFISAAAQTATKMEAESATYENCKLIEDGKYSDGKALELTEGNAKITLATLPPSTRRRKDRARPLSDPTS